MCHMMQLVKSHTIRCSIGGKGLLGFWAKEGRETRQCKTLLPFCLCGKKYQTASWPIHMCIRSCKAVKAAKLAASGGPGLEGCAEQVQLHLEWQQ